MARRTRVDTITAAKQIAATAGQIIDPPEHAHLPNAALPFWAAIVRGRAREEWEAAPALLVTAANLAWTQWQIVNLRHMIDGTVPPFEGCSTAVLVTRMNDLQRLEMAYLRTLQQHGRAVQGEARDTGKRRAVAQAAANGVMSGDDDDLLARRTVN